MSEKVQRAVREGLGEMIQQMRVHSERRIYVDVAPEDLLEAARCLFEGLGARFAIASGLQIEGGFEILYHFAFDSEHVLVSLRVRSGEDPPRFPSLTPMIAGASFIEREMHDLLGMDFPGHPDLKRLILPEDWPEDVYPLRRGKPWEGKVKKHL